MPIVIPMDDYLDLYAKKNKGPLPECNEPTVKDQINHVMKDYFDSVLDKHHGFIEEDDRW